jgi:hypothetical protein
LTPNQALDVKDIADGLTKPVVSKTEQQFNFL